MTDDRILIRPVRLADAPGLQQRCFSANTPHEVEDRVRESLRLREEGGGVRVVAEVGGVVVGTALLRRSSNPLCAHCADIEDVVVGGDYQRRGIARRMLECCRAEAARMGIEILEVSARAGTVAEQAYRGLGFIECGRLPGGLKEPWGEQKVYDIVYFYQPVRSKESG